MTYNVTCSTDDNYLQHCSAMLCSLFDNNKELDFVVWVLVKKLSEQSYTFLKELGTRYGNEVKIIEVDERDLDGVGFSNNTYVTLQAYYRLLLPKILPVEVENILYLDCDVIVLHSVKPLYELNLYGYGLAAVKDVSPGSCTHREQLNLDMRQSAFCSGVMVINLKYWRENDSMTRLLEFAKKKRIPYYFADQDALNYVFRGCWFMLPYKWGKSAMSIVPVDTCQRFYDIDEYVNSPCIYHYASFVKPWLNISFPGREYYWKYARLSGFKNLKETEAKKQVRRMINKLKVRYNLNRYIRPFVPDLIEIVVFDIVNIVMLLLGKKSSIQRWCEKYGMK